MSFAAPFAAPSAARAGALRHQPGAATMQPPVVLAGAMKNGYLMIWIHCPNMNCSTPMNSEILPITALPNAAPMVIIIIQRP